MSSNSTWTFDEFSDFGTVWSAQRGSISSFGTLDTSAFNALVHPEQDLAGFELELGEVAEVTTELIPIWELALPIGLFVGAIAIESWLSHKSHATKERANQLHGEQMAQNAETLALEGSVPFVSLPRLVGRRTRRRRRQ
jgi:hypothetical protein